jgi:hypothetical protein
VTVDPEVYGIVGGLAHPLDQTEVDIYLVLELGLNQGTDEGTMACRKTLRLA